MKNKRIWLLFTIFAGAFLFLAACGNDPVDGGATNGTTGSDEVGVPDNITFRFSWWGNDPRHEATIEIIDLWMLENPHVTIIHENAPWSGFQDAFAISLEGGQEADLMQVNFPWLPLYSPYGTTFLDLETVSDYLVLDNWSADHINFMRMNGVLQAVPVGITSRVPFLNYTLYERAGISRENLPTTWEELIEAGRTIQAELGDNYWALSPLGPVSASYLVFSYLEQVTGRQFVDENQNFSYTLEELTRGFQLFQDFMDNGVVPHGQFDSDPMDGTNRNLIQGFYGGVSDWDSSINNLLDNVEEHNVFIAHPHFTMQGAQLSGVMARPSMGFAISRNSNHPEEVARFLNFMLTDPRAVEIMGVDRGIPSNNVAAEHFQSLNLGGRAIDANNIHRNAETTVLLPIFENPIVREIYETAIEQLQFGVLTVEEAAQQVYDRLPAAIREALHQ